MLTKYLKFCMVETIRGDSPNTTNWLKFVDFVQTELREGFLVGGTTWHTVLLLPKGTGNFRGIGLVEFIWKTVTVILNLRLGVITTFHNFLHGSPLRQRG